MRTLAGILLAPCLLLGACYKPRFDITPDGSAGFLCFASDSPPCPQGLVCCVEGRSGPVCGEDLLRLDPTREGRCRPPPPPATPMPWKDWDLGTKSTVVAATGDPMLTGFDENMVWRCPRDDKNPAPPPEIVRRFEPNDSIPQAIVYSSNLAIDGTPPPLTAYEICPDKSAPAVPDVDVFKFRIGGNTAVKVVIEVKYQVSFGDLDVGLFREMITDTREKIPQRLMQDVTAQNDACIVANSLSPGTYYVAVRGAPTTPGEYQTATQFFMNTYRIRIYGQTMGTPGGCAAPVGDMR
ncbi:MAG: hypothetical protein NZ890_02310 [Myxococcota bacterium]|nr:hypothetical protein [Myxococcota bacterium]